MIVYLLFVPELTSLLHNFSDGLPSIKNNKRFKQAPHDSMIDEIVLIIIIIMVSQLLSCITRSRSSYFVNKKYRPI